MPDTHHPIHHPSCSLRNHFGSSSNFDCTRFGHRTIMFILWIHGLFCAFSRCLSVRRFVALLRVQNRYSPRFLEHRSRLDCAYRAATSSIEERSSPPGPTYYAHHKQIINHCLRGQPGPGSRRIHYLRGPLYIVVVVDLRRGAGFRAGLCDRRRDLLCCLHAGRAPAPAATPPCTMLAW